MGRGVKNISLTIKAGGGAAIHLFALSECFSGLRPGRQGGALGWDLASRQLDDWLVKKKTRDRYVGRFTSE